MSPEELRPSVEPHMSAGEILPARRVYTEWELEQSKKLEEYLARPDLPLPDDDETARPNPFKGLVYKKHD